MSTQSPRSSALGKTVGVIIVLAIIVVYVRPIIAGIADNGFEYVAFGMFCLLVGYAVGHSRANA